MDDELTDPKKRHFLIASTATLGGIGALCAMTPLVTSLMPSAKARALGAPVAVDISRLEPGQQATVLWRGKPVWIIRRTKEMLKTLSSDGLLLRDPDSFVPQQPEYAKNGYRSRNPEYLVLIGICTHLGCSPKYEPLKNELGPDWPGGFYCPCHGSRFDLAGRVFKNMPAPINLEVPPYRFADVNTIIIGEDEVEKA